VPGERREQRYESAAALANDLAMHLSDRPISAGKPSRLHHLQKFVRRNKGPCWRRLPSSCC
jgi:hypothetical protein